GYPTPLPQPLTISCQEPARKMNLLSLAIPLLVGAISAGGQDVELILAGGRIVDGTGNPWFRADIGIRNGRIAEIGKLSGRTSRRTINLNDEVVSPGFIDMMGASSLPLLDDPPSAESKLRQGITTLLAGEGVSAAPQNEQPIGVGQSRGKLRWRTFAEYFQLLEQKGMAMNAIHNVGATQIRLFVIGD